MDNKYIGDWERESYTGLKRIDALRDDFEIDEDVIKDEEIIVAFYLYESYSGIASVLFKRDDKYFIVEGSHCSCYGLEGQWNEEEISLEYISHRIENGCFADWASHYEERIKERLRLFIIEELENGL